MTYRDPLYDANSPQDSTLDDQIEVRSGQSLGSGGASGKAGEMKEQGKQAMSQAQEKADKAKEKGAEVADQAKSKASELGGQAHAKSDQGIDKASSGLSTAADKLRQQGEKQEGQVGQVASTAADKLESASGYLQEKNSDQLVSDLEDLVRRKPMESLLAAAGIGLLLSRIFR